MNLQLLIYCEIRIQIILKYQNLYLKLIWLIWNDYQIAYKEPILIVSSSPTKKFLIKQLKTTAFYYLNFLSNLSNISYFFIDVIYKLCKY